MELQCRVQNYDWGKLGMDSFVAQLIASADPSVSISSTTPYAELWMGTHPNGPSIIRERNITLLEYLRTNLDAVGPVVKRSFNDSMPFLFKILSIRKALSIQAHPAKAHAEVLHKNFPYLYNDANHKPELAIALTPFKSLCGFRPFSEIKGFINQVPELRNVLGENAVKAILSHSGVGDTTKLLKYVFHSLMMCDKNKINTELETLLDRLEDGDLQTQTFFLFPLLNRLYSDYPGDVGCWAPYFMNYIKLMPGESIYLKPNLPHSYLSGDCIECMARSDNVVRAGFTEKYKDMITLIEMLDYNSYHPSEMLFIPQIEDPYSCSWRPPFTDFAVIKMKVRSQEMYNTTARPSPSIIIILSGSGEACDTEPIAVRPGVVIFLKASRQLTLRAVTDIEAYQAVCNI